MTTSASRVLGRAHLASFGAPAVLVAVALMVFAPVLFCGRTMYPTDITNNLFLPFAAAAHSTTGVQVTALIDYVLYYYPARWFQAHSFQSGTLGLWNPYVFGGHPTFASSGSSVALDPFNLLLLAVSDLGTALAWRSFLQVLACMVFMYLYLRHLGLGSPAGLVGAIGFGLNSMFWANVFDWSVAGMLWVPLVCLLADRSLQQGSASRAVCAGLVLGVALLSSPLQVYFYVCVIVCSVVGLRWFVWPPDRERMHRRLALALLILFIGVALTAVQVLPTLELLRQAPRFTAGAFKASAKAVRSPAQMALATAGLVSFVFPNLIGRLKGSMMVSGALWGGETHWQGFIGVLPFVFMILGGFAKKNAWRLPYLVLALGSIVIVVYTPLMVVVYERFFLVYIFAASVLAAIGVQAVADRAFEARHWRLALRLLTGLFALIFILLVVVNVARSVDGNRLRAVVEREVSRTLSSNYLGSAYPALYLAKASAFFDDLRLTSLNTALPFLFFAASLWLALLALRCQISRRAFGIAAVALTAADMVFMSLSHVPLVDRLANPFAPPSAAIEAMRVESSLSRVLSVRAPGRPPLLPLGTAVLYGLQSASGYDNLWPPNLLDLVALELRPCGPETCLEPSGTAVANIEYLLTDRVVRLPAPRFELVYDKEVRVFRDTWCLPRTYWTGAWDVVPQTARAIERARMIDILSDARVIVDRAPEGVLPAGGTARGAVKVLAYGATDVQLEVDAPAAGLVVLSDTYYPGWIATVDRAVVPILRSNGVMRAVAVKSGRHMITFRFAPRSLAGGACISCGALLIACAFLVFRRDNRNTEPKLGDLNNRRSCES